MIALCDTGLINLKSLQRAFEHLGQMAIVTSNTEEISCCDHIVLCASGTFEEGFMVLRKNRLDRAIRAAAAAGKPILGIGLGMQLLMQSSDEGGLFKGMGLLPYDVRAAKPGKRAEGFYSTNNTGGTLFCGLEESSFFYSQSSFIRSIDGACATAEYEGIFCAAAARDMVAGVAFYPHKSGRDGLKVLDNFLKQT